MFRPASKLPVLQILCISVTKKATKQQITVQCDLQVSTTPCVELANSNTYDLCLYISTMIELILEVACLFYCDEQELNANKNWQNHY